MAGILLPVVYARGEPQMSLESNILLYLCNSNNRLLQPVLTKQGHTGPIYSNGITSQKLIIHRVSPAYFWHT